MKTDKNKPATVDHTETAKHLRDLGFTEAAKALAPPDPKAPAYNALLVHLDGGTVTVRDTQHPAGITFTVTARPDIARAFADGFRRDDMTTIVESIISTAGTPRPAFVNDEVA